MLRPDGGAPDRESGLRLVLGTQWRYPKLMARLEAVYESSAVRLQASGNGPGARRAARYAAFVRFGIDQPEAMWRLYASAKELRRATGTTSVLDGALGGAIALLGGDKGNAQLIDPHSGALHLVAHRGFDDDFLEYFAVVDGDGTACGRAANTARPSVIADVNRDKGFSPYRELAAAAEFRAVLSLPMMNDLGKPIAVLSIHYRRPHRPSPLHLRLIENYSYLTAEAITRQTA